MYKIFLILTVIRFNSIKKYLAFPAGRVGQGLKKKMIKKKVLFIIAVNLCLLGFIFVLNINSLAVGSVFLSNILNFILNKLLLFICVLPVVFLSSWGIISGFFGVDVKQKYLTEINKPYIFIYIFIFTLISTFLIKYNVIYAHSVQNNFELVLQGPGQEISFTSTGIDYFSKTLNIIGNAGVKTAAVNIVGKLLTQHPELGMSAKTGFLILGTGGTLATYNIIKKVSNLGESKVVSTSITLSNSNIPVSQSAEVANILPIKMLGRLDILSGLSDKLYSVNNDVTHHTIRTMWGYLNIINNNLTCKTNQL